MTNKPSADTTTQIQASAKPNRMRSQCTILPAIGVILLVSTALYGCAGSSGGGGSTTTPAPIARSMPTNVIRTMLNGDNIQYAVTGNVNGTALTGTATSTVTPNSSPVDPNGNKQTVGTTTINATLSTGATVTSTTNSYISQDASGTIFTHGDSASGWITNPATGFITSMISPVVSPYSWVQTFTYQNGDTTTETISVGGPVAVTTGVGTFDSYTYTIDATTILGAGGKRVSSQISYVVPDIGTVKMVITLTQTAANGSVTTSKFNLSMSATNIAYP